MDRISLGAPEHPFEEQVRMNKLAAAFYMMSQGVPFLQAGEEMLRSKPNGKGGYVENSYKSPDSINSIKWGLLEHPVYRDTVSYYKGLIQFRKHHPVLRLTNIYDVLSHVIPISTNLAGVCAFRLMGNITFEPAQELFMVFNASESEITLPLPNGQWQIYIDGETAGTERLGAVEQFATIAPISALVLAKDKM